jgi:hypothetical protein
MPPAEPFRSGASSCVKLVCVAALELMTAIDWTLASRAPPRFRVTGLNIWSSVR